jgi:2-amino-4-hydroxy-6-hydroxymethyldihydropteridine diphosphokinase
MVKSLIALGGNVGDVAATFPQAHERLGQVPGVTFLRASRLFRTVPAGASAGGEFLNAACEVETSLSPLALLTAMKSIEESLGRKRDVFWGPRTLDLDLIFYGDLTIQVAGLTVPHPACAYRRFVLDPLCDLSPNLVHPAYRVSLARLKQRLLPRPLSVRLYGATELASSLVEPIRSHFPGVAVHVNPPFPREEHALAAGLDLWLGGTTNDRHALEETIAAEQAAPWAVDLSMHQGRLWEAIEFVLVSALDAPQPQ